MADEQNTPSEVPNPDETTPIEPVVIADQGPAEVSAPVAAPERSPWIRRGLVAAGVVGLMAVSGVAGFAIGHESDDRGSFDQLTAQRGPDGDGPRGGGDQGGGMHGDGDQGGGMHGDGDQGGDMRGHHDMDGMPDGDRGFGRDRAPGMQDLPTPDEMLQWLQDQGVDMQQFMDEFGSRGMGEGGMGQGGMGQGMRQSS